jgi:hypothetical protein
LERNISFEIPRRQVRRPKRPQLIVVVVAIVIVIGINFDNDNDYDYENDSGLKFLDVKLCLDFTVIIFMALPTIIAALG